MATKAIIIGVSGGSGSGKTFFAEALAHRIGKERSFVLYQDNYYFDQSNKFDHDGGSVNFDHPDSIDFNLMASHLKMLKDGHDIEIPIYDFATHSRINKTIAQKHKPVIIVDGILILTQKIIRDELCESIFVHTPEEIRYKRRLMRDVNERGRTPEGVEAQFQKQVKPMHDQFVEPSKQYANIISSGTDMDIFNKLLNNLINICNAK